jgi:hypothetical protein
MAARAADQESPGLRRSRGSQGSALSSAAGGADGCSRQLRAAAPAR